MHNTSSNLSAKEYYPQKKYPYVLVIQSILVARAMSIRISCRFLPIQFIMESKYCPYEIFLSSHLNQK